MPGSTVSDVELTILSLVAESPRYGAEIEQMIELRGVREWLTVGSASIYYILGRLEQQELLTHQLQQGRDGLARTVYQITEAGWGVVQTAIADLLRQPRPLGQGFALGLANCAVLKPSQVYHTLIQHRDRLAHQLESAQALWERRQHEETPSEGTQALYTHGIVLMQAELGWLNQFIEDWRVRHPAVDPDEPPDGDGAPATQVHHPTSKVEREKQIQKLKRPKDGAAE